MDYLITFFQIAFSLNVNRVWINDACHLSLKDGPCKMKQCGIKNRLVINYVAINENMLALIVNTKCIP